MLNIIDSMQPRDEDVEVIMKQSYQELSQSLIDIKNNIKECILDLENTTQIESPLVDTMRNSIKDIERAKKAINVMRTLNFKSIDLSYE